MIGLLIALIVVCLAWWAATALMRAFSVGDPIATVVKVVFVVLVILWLVSFLGYGSVMRLK